jgi:dephospho-CoA kinase
MLVLFLKQCSLLAPHISSAILWEVIKLWLKGCKVIILDIPLLFETKMNIWTQPVLVVWVDPETQIQRLIARDGISEEQAKNRIEAQMPLDLKREKAALVIDNSGSLEETKVQFEQVLAQVNSPLSLKECALSRDGFISIILSLVVGAIIVKKNVC